MTAISPEEFDDWRELERAGKVRELQSQSDFKSMHGVPSEQVVGKTVIKTRWVLKELGDSVKAKLVMKHFNTWKDSENQFYAGTPLPVSLNLLLVLAASRVVLGKSQTLDILDISTAFLHADMKDEIYVKLDSDTLHLIREEGYAKLATVRRWWLLPGGQSAVWTTRRTKVVEGGSARCSERAGHEAKLNRQFCVHIG